MDKYKNKISKEKIIFKSIKDLENYAVIDVVLNDEIEWIFDEQLKLSSSIFSKVICLDAKMHLGDISNGDFLQKRLEVFSLNDERYELYFGEDDASDNQSWLEYHSECIKDIEFRENYLKEELKKGNTIRIWYRPYISKEMCNLYWLLASLYASGVKESQIEFIVIPEMNFINGFIKEEFIKFVSCSFPANKAYLSSCKSSWEHLKKENQPLRILREGVMLSMPIDFYDADILKIIDSLKETFRCVQVANPALTKYFIDTEWLISRLSYFEKEGHIRTVSYGKCDMDRTFRKCNTN